MEQTQRKKSHKVEQRSDLKKLREHTERLPVLKVQVKIRFKLLPALWIGEVGTSLK